MPYCLSVCLSVCANWDDIRYQDFHAVPIRKYCVYLIHYLEGRVCAHALPEHLGGHVADGADALVGGAVVDVAPVALEADGEAEVGDGDGAVALDLKVSCVASYAKQ